MPRRAIRSANCHREIADSSVALPKDRMPCAYNERASSHRRRSSASPAGKRRLRATESETVSVMLVVLLRVYVVGASIWNTGSPASTGAPEAGPPEKKTAGARRKAPAGLVRGNSDLSTGPSRKKWLHSQLLTSL